MKESEIQKILEEVIQTGNLLEKIGNIDLIKKRYQSYDDKNSLPSFLLDYLSTKNAIIAAINVLQAIQVVRIITTASNNISIDRTQRLFPDLILFNEEQHQLTIVEIKRSNKTVRETLTEIIAYESEIKNILPFLSNYEINFCIISTEYSDLLNHSISGLITWELKQILCLQIEQNQEDFKLMIHIPDAWTSTGSITFPQNAISTFQLILYQQSNNITLQDAESAVFHAASLIAREGDRNKSHGFVLVWYDCWEGWENVGGSTKFHLTVGFINPYVFLPFAQNLGIIDTSQNIFCKYLIENAENFACGYLSNEKNWQKGIRYLKQFFQVNIEGLSCWDVERAKAYEINSVLLTMRHRALPLRIEMWGALGDFTREFISHPGVKNFILSGISNKIIGCEDPFIGIPILDTVSGVHKLDSRGITCKILFDLGVSLGSISTLYNTGNCNQDKTFKNLPASITWYMLDAQPTLVEIAKIYVESSSVTVPPPAIKVRTAKEFEEGLLSIQSFIEWMNDYFFTEQYTIQRLCFQLGLGVHPLLDSYLICGLNNEQKENLEDDVCNTSNYFLKNIVKACFSENQYFSDEEIDNIINDVSQKYLEYDIQQLSVAQIFLLIDKIPKNKHLKLYHTTLMNLLDSLVLPINHNNSLSADLAEYQFIDWIWVREKILYLRERGVQFPGLKVDINGVFDIIDLSIYDYLIPIKDQIDFKNNFPFLISNGGIQTLLVKEWKEVGL